MTTTAAAFSAFFAVFAGNLYAIPPEVPPAAPLSFKPAKGIKAELPSGLKVYLLENHELPVIEAYAMIRTGSVYEPSGKTGLAELLGVLLRTGGSGKYSPDQINETLEYLGASVETGMDLEHGTASFFCLSKDLDQVLDIFADVLQNPVFRKDKLRLEKEKLLEQIRRRNDDPIAVVRREVKRMLYGTEHPYGRRMEAEEIKKISRKDLLAFHRGFYRSDAVSIAVSGDFKSGEMLEKLKKAFAPAPSEALSACLPAGPCPQIPDSSAALERKVYLAAKPGVTQTAVTMAQFGLKRHDPDHFVFEILDDILGGSSFSSRLFANIRSRMGLAYGVRSAFTEPQKAGMILAGVGTKNQTAAKAIEAVLAELKKMKEEPVSQEELDLSKNSIINSFVFNFQTPFKIISQRMSLDYYGYPEDYLDTYLDKIREVDAQKIQQAAQKWLKPENMILYVVGNPAEFDKPLSSFGPVEEKPLD